MLGSDGLGTYRRGPVWAKVPPPSEDSGDAPQPLDGSDDFFSPYDSVRSAASNAFQRRRAPLAEAGREWFAAKRRRISDRFEAPRHGQCGSASSLAQDDDGIYVSNEQNSSLEQKQSLHGALHASQTMRLLQRSFDDGRPDSGVSSSLSTRGGSELIEDLCTMASETKPSI